MESEHNASEPDKQKLAHQIEILLAVYKENCDQARQHENLRERITAIVAQTVGVMLGLAGFGTLMTAYQPIHYAVPAFVILLGIWGLVASWKHNERSKLHNQRIRQCRKKLSGLGHDYLDQINLEADKLHDAEFRREATRRAARQAKKKPGGRLHIFWSAFHIGVTILGVVVLILMLCRC